MLFKAVNTHLLRKMKYHCMDDFLFDWFGFDQTSKSVVNSTQANQLNQNQSNRWFVSLSYSDTSPCELSECSLCKVRLYNAKLRNAKVTLSNRGRKQIEGKEENRVHPGFEGGVVVNVLAFLSEDPSSNPTEDIFYCKTIYSISKYKNKSLNIPLKMIVFL